VPPGASGSSTTIAIVFAGFVVVATPLHSRGGEMLTPSQVYARGIDSPSLKAELVSLISVLLACAELTGGWVIVGEGFEHPDIAKQSRTNTGRDRICMTESDINFARAGWRLENASLYSTLESSSRLPSFFAPLRETRSASESFTQRRE
jgi:hypothetical protein